MEESVLRVRCRWKTVVLSSSRMVKSWKTVKPMETASSSQRSEQKICRRARRWLAEIVGRSAWGSAWGSAC
jgi:hypothetical protein